MISEPQRLHGEDEGGVGAAAVERGRDHRVEPAGRRGEVRVGVGDPGHELQHDGQQRAGGDQRGDAGQHGGQQAARLAHRRRREAQADLEADEGERDVLDEGRDAGVPRQPRAAQHGRDDHGQQHGAGGNGEQPGQAEPARARAGRIGQVGRPSGAVRVAEARRGSVGPAEEERDDQRGGQDHDQHARVLHEGHEPGVGPELVAHGDDPGGAAGHEAEQRRRPVHARHGREREPGQERHAERGRHHHGDARPALAQRGEGVEVERGADGGADQRLGHLGDPAAEHERRPAGEREGEADQQRREQRGGGEPGRAQGDAGHERGQADGEPAGEHPPHHGGSPPARARDRGAQGTLGE